MHPSPTYPESTPPNAGNLVTESLPHTPQANPTDHIDAALVAAAACLQNDRIADAEAIARSLLDQQPGLPEALQILALAARTHGDLGAAGEYLLQAIRTTPNVATYHANLGTVFLEQGQTAEAERALQIALQLDPEQHSARYNRGNLYLQTGRPRLAESDFRAVLSADPTNAGAHHNLALILEQRGALAEAREHLQESIRLAPKASVCLQSLARIEAAEGQLRASLASLDQALNVNPAVGEPQLARGQTLQALGQFEAAQQAFRAFLRMGPRDPFLASQALQSLRLADDSLSEAEWREHAIAWRHLFRSQAVLTAAEDADPQAQGSRPRIAVLSISGTGPSGLLQALIEALDTAGGEVHLWCVDPPGRLADGVTVHRFTSPNPREIAESVRALRPGLLLQVGGLEAPELLGATLACPVKRVAIWATHPRLDFPEIELWLDGPLSAVASGDGPRPEQPLLVPEGAWPANNHNDTDTPVGRFLAPIVVPSSPATLTPHVTALLSTLAAVSEHDVVMTHPDFELTEIRTALLDRWRAMGLGSEPKFAQKPPQASLVIMADRASAPYASLAPLSKGLPVLLVPRNADPAEQAACSHLWTEFPEIRCIPQVSDRPEALSSWASHIGTFLADEAAWERVSCRAKAPPPPTIADALAARILAHLHRG